MAYLKPDLLILDDFAMKDLTASQAEDVYELVDARVGRSSFIVTSNRAPEDWYPLFPNPVLAESALDRLVNAAHHVTLNAKSYRPRLRPGRPPPTTPGAAENVRNVRNDLLELEKEERAD